MRRLSRRRTARYEEGRYLIDGPTLLAEAIDSGVRIEAVYAEPQAQTHEVLRTLDDSVVVRHVAEGTLAKVLDVVSPNGMVAVGVIDLADPAQIIRSAKDHCATVLVLVDVGDPGNAGTLLRASEAAGCVGVIMAGECTDPFAPKVVRASAGSIFRIPVAITADVDELLNGIQSAGVQSWATVISGGVTPEAADMSGASVVVVGNEAHGLDPLHVSMCSGSISIPMKGNVESLNAAMAATIVLFEGARQRRSR